MKKNVIIYCRVSTDKQSKMGESLEVQEQQCREYCKRNDYQVLAVFSEQFTWTKDKRPKVEEALTFIKNSELKIEHIIVLKIDRVSRWWIWIHDSFKQQFKNLWVTLKDTYWIIWEDRNVIEIEWINTDKYNWAMSNTNQIAENVTVMMSENERNTILQRMLWQAIKNNMRWYKVRNSEYWYQNKKVMTNFWRKTIQVENKEEAVYIKKMFELKARWDLSDEKIVEEINLMGYRSRKKVKWNKEKTKIIGNVWDKSLNVKQFQRFIKMSIYAWIVCEEWTWNKPVKTPYDWLVSLEVWNRANKWKYRIIKDSNSEYEIEFYKWENRLEEPIIQKHKNYNPDYPYGRVLVCPICKWHLTAEKSRSKNLTYHHYYSCRWKKWAKHTNYWLRRKPTDDYIVDLFSSIKFDKNVSEIFDVLSKEVYDNRKSIYSEKNEIILRNIKELESKKDFIVWNIQNLINYPDLLEAQNQELQNINQKIKELSYKKNNSWTLMGLKRFQDSSKKVLEHLDKLVLQRENLDVIQLVFDVVFDGKIEFDEMKSRTPITKEFLALGTKTDFQKKWKSAWNTLWWETNSSFHTIKEWIVKMFDKIDKWQYVIDKVSF